MAGPTQALGAAPSYVSARSADVILSDIRPTKLSPEALTSINVFLDEFLYTILNASHALGTAKIRGGVNRILPTTLGKEAVLEAEMELRAYWERKGGNPEHGPEEGDWSTQWMFELLRLKCEGYSTLSDTDESAEAEARLYERMKAQGVRPPQPSVLDPAALYLTAIIEAVCEHVLSNVGRVAARDSSRTVSNAHDLFTALCEDATVYGLFRSMKVYEQIESFSKAPHSRRTKSFSKDSPHAPPVSFQEPSETPRRDSSLNSRRSQTSSDLPVPPGLVNSPSPTPSVEKTKGPFKSNGLNGRASFDRGSFKESRNGHHKTESTVSVGRSLHGGTASPTSSTFDEFDDMMRSGATMKVSLTPDRLKTMETFNKEKEKARALKTNGKSKEKRASDVPPVPSLPLQSSGVPQRQLRHVDSIIEDEEEPSSVQRPRQQSVSSTPPVSSAPIRKRSVSSVTNTKHTPKTPSFSNFAPFMKPSSSNAAVSAQKQITAKDPDPEYPKPQRKRKVVSNIEDMDLDDIMGEPDKEDLPPPPQSPTPKGENPRGLSANARDLIDFLSEGPPEPPQAPLSNDSIASFDPPKRSGRLQKMISKITLSSDARSRSDSDGRISPRKGFVSPEMPSSPAGTTRGNVVLKPLANKPIPPRYYPRPPSPSATSQSSGDKDKDSTPQTSRSRATSTSRKPVPLWDGNEPMPESVMGAENSSVPDASSARDPSPKPPASAGATIATPAKRTDSLQAPSPQTLTIPSGPVNAPQRTSSKRAMENGSKRNATPKPDPQFVAVNEHARDMRRLLSSATNAEECRLIVDMFMAKCKISIDPTDLDGAAAPPEDVASNAENVVIEALLGEAQLDISSATPPPVPDRNPARADTTYEQPI